MPKIPSNKIWTPKTIKESALSFDNAGDWKKYKISLKTFEDLGANMSKIKTAFLITSKSKNNIGIGNIRLE